jgi:hypothetical protein
LETRTGSDILAECLPESLEYLRILGYKQGVAEEWDLQVQGLINHVKSGLSNLKELTGVEELIPSAEHMGYDSDLEDPLNVWRKLDTWWSDSESEQGGWEHKLILLVPECLVRHRAVRNEEPRPYINEHRLIVYKKGDSMSFKPMYSLSHLVNPIIPNNPQNST